MYASSLVWETIQLNFFVHFIITSLLTWTILSFSTKLLNLVHCTIFLQGLLALVREYMRGLDDVEADTSCTLRNKTYVHDQSFLLQFDN